MLRFWMLAVLLCSAPHAVWTQPAAATTTRKGNVANDHIDGGKSACGKSDDPRDCAALIDLAQSTGYKHWTSRDGWLMSGVSVCQWFGVTCKKERVSKLQLKSNNLSGSVPESIVGLSKLTVLDLRGARPPQYGPESCLAQGGNNFNNSAMPHSFYALENLVTWNMEYTCLGGTLSPAIGNMLKLQDMLIHGNFISGTLPTEIDDLPQLVQHKLGRNPISGTLPSLTRPKPLLEKYNCNFCALTGTFPDTWSPDKFPKLTQFFWDGNGFSGTLPASVGSLKTLTTLSFNINNFAGEFPKPFCKTKAPDCRIGADHGQAGLARYQAIYPWTLSMNASGNRFECGNKKTGVPACITEGSNCNKTYKDPEKNSPVLCI